MLRRKRRIRRSRGQVTIPLKPRPDFWQISLGGDTSDGDLVRPAAKTRARSIPLFLGPSRTIDPSQHPELGLAEGMLIS